MEDVAQVLKEAEETLRAAAQTAPVEQTSAAETEAQHAKSESLAAALAEREAKLAETEAQLAQELHLNQQAQAQLQQLQQELTLALGKYRAALLAGSPEVPEELVQGGTVAEMDEAFGRARALVERLRRQLEAAARKERVPAGAPPRQAPDLSALTPHQKILLGLQKRAG